MRHVNHRVLWHAPYGRSRIAGRDKMIGANRGRRNTGTLQMNSVVHTARAAGSSIAYTNDGHVARLDPILDYLWRHGSGGRRFAVSHDAGKTVPLVEYLSDHIQ